MSDRARRTRRARRRGHGWPRRRGPGRHNRSRLTTFAPRCRGLERDQYGVASSADTTARHTASARLIA